MFDSISYCFLFKNGRKKVAIHLRKPCYIPEVHKREENLKIGKETKLAQFFGVVGVQ